MKSRAGATSGALSTTQQVGYALGVAVTGLIFFGAGAGDVGHAFELCLLQQTALALAIVVSTRLLPRSDALRDGAPEPATAPARA